MLSVIVPVHNVSSYIDDCLASLAGQTFADIEVVVVDDGSTDDSAARAAAFTALDARFRLVSQANRGLGAARNAGVAAARGDYLAFVDADDIVPAHAFEVLVGALDATGSDFASGNVCLLTEGRLSPSPLHRGTHRVPHLAADPRAHRYLVYDRLACNKVFRRTFWGETTFPEGVHYEDIPVTVPAYGRATAVDVVDLPVYYWRQRPPGDRSISQRLAEPKNLEDRFAAVTSARASLAAIDADFAAWYAETALQSDLRLVLEILPEAGEAYRRRFLGLTSAFLAGVDPAVLTRLPRRLSAAWRRAAEGDLPAVDATVRSTRAGDPPSTGMTAWRDPAPPEPVLASLEWVGETLRLHLAGAPLPVGVVWLREGRPTPGAGTPATARAVLLAARTRAGRLTAALRTARLRTRRGWPRGRRRHGDWRPGEWTFNASPARAAVRALLRVADPDVALPARWVGGRALLVPEVRAGVLRLRVEVPTLYAAAVGQVGQQLVVEGAGHPGEGAVLALERTPGVRFAAYPIEAPDRAVLGDGRGGPPTIEPGPARPHVDLVDAGGAYPTTVERSGWTARVPLADLVAGAGRRALLDGEVPARWRVVVATAGGEVMPLPAGPDLVPGANAAAGAGGVLTLSARPATA